MTDLRQAAQQALEALETLMIERESIYDKAITVLRTALEQQAEPVAWAVQGTTQMIRGEFAELNAKAKARRIGGTCVAYPLYTTPPAPSKRQWLGLEAEDLAQIEIDEFWQVGNHMAIAMAVEAKLKERNK